MRKNHQAEDLKALWKRELIADEYFPPLVRVHTNDGPLTALNSIANRESKTYISMISHEQIVHVASNSIGQYGTTLEYLCNTAQSLKKAGLQDKLLTKL